MRGKPDFFVSLLVNHGITPADAGKTVTHHQLPPSTQDHPRGCGENRVPLSEIDMQIGSPPRMRGKPFINSPRVYCRGITPADAGKTYIIIALICQYLGSPPRMRGKPRERVKVQRVNGITPADAGKTGFFFFAFALLEDHPRGCGENCRQ